MHVTVYPIARNTCKSFVSQQPLSYLCPYNHLPLNCQELAQRAADSNVTLGLEVINRYETNVLNTAKQVGGSVWCTGASWHPLFRAMCQCHVHMLAKHISHSQQGMEMLADINEPNVTIHLDTYHMNIEETSMADAVFTCGDKLGYVHIGESHRGYLGTGSVDFDGLFKALAAIDYKVGRVGVLLGGVCATPHTVGPAPCTGTTHI